VRQKDKRKRYENSVPMSCLFDVKMLRCVSGFFKMAVKMELTFLRKHLLAYIRLFYFIVILFSCAGLDIVWS